MKTARQSSDAVVTGNLARISNECDSSTTRELRRLRAQAVITSLASRGRALDGIPELLADADGLEAELQIIADALRRVVAGQSISIAILPDGAAKDSTKLTVLVSTREPGSSGWPAEELAQLALARWLKRPASSRAWISSEGCTVLPIVYQRECVGTVSIEHGDLGMPTDARLRDLGNLIGLAALTIAHHRLKSESTRRLAEMAALRQVGQVVSAGLSADRVLDGIFVASAEILSFDTASLFVVDTDQGILRLAASRNIPAEIARNCQFQIGEGVVGWVIAQARPAIVPDTLKDERFALSSGPRRRRAHSLLVVPLRMRGEVIAAVSFARHQPNAFSDHDLELAEVIATYAAQALEHARLTKTAAEVDSLRQGAELLSSISHDVRAPLSLIKVVVGLLRHEFPSMDAQQLDLLNKIGRASDQLGKMINAALETSRLESNLLKLSPEWLRLRELVDDVTTALTWKVSAKQKLVIDVPVDLDVWCDPTQLHRVLSNLVDNAIKYSPNGGDVTIRGWREEDGLLISVSDHGMGIDEDQVGQVFERYYRGAGEASASTGFGLGLYICKRIVEAHHGAIRAESRLGVGSTFTIWIPADESPVTDLG